MNKYVQNLKIGDEVVLDLSYYKDKIFIHRYVKVKICNITKSGRITVHYGRNKLTFQSNLSGWGNNYFLVNFENESEVIKYNAYRNYINYKDSIK